jgi:hypothetical protein
VIPVVTSGIPDVPCLEAGIKPKPDISHHSLGKVEGSEKFHKMLFIASIQGRVWNESVQVGAPRFLGYLLLVIFAGRGLPAFGSCLDRFGRRKRRKGLDVSKVNNESSMLS